MRSIIINATALFLALIWLPPAFAADAEKIDAKAYEALEALLEKSEKAKEFSREAVAVLVFPRITKAGFIIGGQHGNGALIQDGKIQGYYKSVAVSYGLQAGIQQFGYALFFMNERALGYLDRSDGWEIGLGPSLVVVDKGFAKSMTSTTLKKDIYAFFFNQAGIMAGAGIQGTKITRIFPEVTQLD